MCPYVEVGSAPLRLTLLCASPASGFTTLCVVPVCASSLPSPPPLRAVLPPTADRRPRRGTVERANAHGPPPLQTWRVVPQVCVPRFDARVGRRGWVEGERRGNGTKTNSTSGSCTASLAKGGSTINRRALTRRVHDRAHTIRPPAFALASQTHRHCQPASRLVWFSPLCVLKTWLNTTRRRRQGARQGDDNAANAKWQRQHTRVARRTQAGRHNGGGAAM